MSLKKSYVIVDEKNRWLATGVNETPEQITATIIEVNHRLLEEGDEGVTMFLYETIGQPIAIKTAKP